MVCMTVRLLLLRSYTSGTYFALYNSQTHTPPCNANSRTFSSRHFYTRDKCTSLNAVLYLLLSPSFVKGQTCEPGALMPPRRSLTPAKTAGRQVQPKLNVHQTNRCEHSEVDKSAESLGDRAKHEYTPAIQTSERKPSCNTSKPKRSATDVAILGNDESDLCTNDVISEYGQYDDSRILEEILQEEMNRNATNKGQVIEPTPLEAALERHMIRSRNLGRQGLDGMRQSCAEGTGSDHQDAAMIGISDPLSDSIKGFDYGKIVAKIATKTAYPRRHRRESKGDRRGSGSSGSGREGNVHSSANEGRTYIFLVPGQFKQLRNYGRVGCIYNLYDYETKKGETTEKEKEKNKGKVMRGEVEVIDHKFEVEMEDCQLVGIPSTHKKDNPVMTIEYEEGTLVLLGCRIKQGAYGGTSSLPIPSSLSYAILTYNPSAHGLGYYDAMMTSTNPPPLSRMAYNSAYNNKHHDHNNIKDGISGNNSTICQDVLERRESLLRFVMPTVESINKTVDSMGMNMNAGKMIVSMSGSSIGLDGRQQSATATATRAPHHHQQQQRLHIPMFLQKELLYRSARELVVFYDYYFISKDTENVLKDPKQFPQHLFNVRLYMYM